MIDSVKRSIAKSFSWRMLGFILLSLVTYIVTDSLYQMTIVAVFYHLIQLCLFWFHERAWNSVLWGKTSGICIQMTGMSGAGKTALAKTASSVLRKKGYKVEVIDGDEYRENLCKDLGFSKEDRNTNIRRLGFVGRVFARNNVICIMSAINPYENIRKELKSASDNVKLVYIKCDLDTLIKRDPKGLYKRALLEDGHKDKIYNFTGISDPYEEPENPDLVIETNNEDIDESLNKFIKFILKQIGG